MQPKTILITGGSGYLGQHLTQIAAEHFEVYATFNTNPRSISAGQPVPLNLANRSEIFELITRLQPAAVIHTAAINPGQGHEPEMMQINATGSRYVAQACASVKSRLIHVSTDVVHNGKNGPYPDDAPPTPLNGYGRSKAAAEAAVLQVDPQAAIVRTSLIYGLELMDRGTAGFVQRLEAGETLTLFNDVIRQPVWVDSLAEALLKLVDVEFGGLLNLVGSQPLTREAFGRRMLNWWQVDTRGQLRSGRAADILASIPLDLRMTTEKAERVLGMRLPGVDEVLGAAQAS